MGEEPVLLGIRLEQPSRTIRKRAGEALVELWSAIHDKEREKGAAYRLSYAGERDGELLYESDVTLPFDGYFPLQVRARHRDQRFWEWDSDGYGERTIDLWVDPEWVYDAIVYNAFIRYFGASAVEGRDRVRGAGRLDPHRGP